MTAIQARAQSRSPPTTSKQSSSESNASSSAYGKLSHRPLTYSNDLLTLALLVRRKLMDRRQFLTSVAAGGTLALAGNSVRAAETCCRTFATPGEALNSPPEKLAYVMGVYTGTGV